MSFRKPACAALWLLSCAFRMLAQNASFEGYVKGVDGKPVANALVKIMRYDVKHEFKVKTDKGGRYIYAGLPSGGFFTILVQVDGKDAAAVTGVRSQPGGSLQISFNLGATPDEQLRSVQQDIRKLGGEWSYIKVVPLQRATVAPSQDSGQETRSLSPGQKAAAEKEASERVTLIEQRSELNDAFNTAMTALEAKRYDEAVASFAKLSEAEPKQAPVWLNLGAAYFGLAGARTGPESASTMQKGLDAYAKVVELKPDDAGAHRIYAVALAKAKRTPEMQAELKRCADLDPANAYEAYYNIGAVLINTGENDAAAEAFKMAIAAAPDEPKNAEAYFQYGIALVGKAQVGADGKVIPAPGTVEVFQKYLRLAPDGTNAPNARTMITTLGGGVAVKSVEPGGKKR